MRILFTVCGRAGSKGIRGKNVGDFLGVPLVYYTLAAIDLYRDAVDWECVLALNTDSERLAELVDASGVQHIRVERKPELAEGAASKVAVIASTLMQVSKEVGDSFDYVIDLDITSPLREANDLARVIERRASSDADVVFTVVKSRRNPCFNMVREGENGSYERVLPSRFTARQQAPMFFDMNASIYAYKPEFLGLGAEIFDGKCDIVEMKDTAVLDLDNPDDLELMQVVARHLFETSHEYKVIRDKAVSFGRIDG